MKIVCQQCGTHNKHTAANACSSCHATLSVACPECQALTSPRNHFCEQCATPLPQAPSLLGQEAERRQLSIMFCDLVGSTALSEHLDPEELREVVQAYQEMCAEEIEKMEGYIAQYLGDGILVYFGYPRSHEDEPFRAINAGLGIVNRVASLNERLQLKNGLTIAVRIGIHTGLTVIGDIGTGAKRERLALGETPNIAARIEGLAETNQVAVSDSTYKLAQKYFAFEHMGTFPLKGISQPMPVYRPVVERQASLGTRDESSKWLFVGREQELATLRATWEQAQSGTESLVLLQGGPGIGKSHLLKALIREAEGQEFRLLVSKCSRYHANEAYFPIAELFRRTLDLMGQQAGTRLERLETYFDNLGFPLADTVPFFAMTFGIPLSDAYDKPSLSARLIKTRIQEILRAVGERIAREQPLLLIVEDLQWVDPDTLDLLKYLWEKRSQHRILLVFTARPEFQNPWEQDELATTITLKNLASDQITSLATQLVAGKDLPALLLDQLVRKADGNPLFLEEVMRNILETGLLAEHATHFELSGSLSEIAIPASLKDLLSSRLDQLGSAKELAQLAAVFGRHFSIEVIRAVSGLTQGLIHDSMIQLLEAGLISHQGIDPDILFSFKHTLVQEEAYELLLKRKRQSYHLQIAQVLDQEFPELIRDTPEFVAHHFTTAAAFAEAIPYWLQAGMKALQESAYQEAISYFEKGIALLDEIQGHPLRPQWELGLQAGLAPALLATQGYAHPGVEKAYGRAYELAQTIEDQTQFTSVLRGLWSHYTVKGKHNQAANIAAKLQTIAGQSNDPLLALEAAKAVGATHMWQGHFIEACAILEAALSGLDSTQLPKHQHSYSEHPLVGCYAYLGFGLLLMGHPVRALAVQQKALVFAQQLAHPFSIVYASSFQALAHVFRLEVAEVRKLATEARDMAARYDIGFWQLFNHILLNGCDLAEQQGTQQFERFSESIELFQQQGACLWVSHPLTLVAEALGTQQQLEAAHAVLDRLRALIDRDDEHFYEAEMMRTRGALLLKAGDTEGALSAFHTARDQAIEQGALLFRIRAEVAIARWHRHAGDLDTAKATLEAIWAEMNEEVRELVDGEGVRGMMGS